MIINRSILGGIILLFFIACSDSGKQLTKEIKKLQSNAIQLPSKCLVMQLGKELQEFKVNENALKLVVYADSVECTACAINHIDVWGRFIDYAEQFNGHLKFCFIFFPMKKELHGIKLMIANTKFNYPIILDTLGEFEKLNRHLPINKSLHTFLLDENNNVILVGNPTRNKSIEKMFYSIVEEKLGKPQALPIRDSIN